MATIMYDIPNGPILAGLKEARGFDADAANPGGHVGVQTSTADRTVHVTINFELTEAEYDAIVWQGNPPTIATED